MRRNRNSEFDSRRVSLPNIMAEQQIRELQQAIQRLQEEHQQAIASLQQQMENRPQVDQQPVQLFQLTADQILNKFQKIKTFYGKEDYPLHEFFSAVENVVALCGNNINLIQHGLQMVVKEKIQGDAKMCIQRLGDNVTWPQVKAELKTQFRPRKSYRRLFDELRNIKVGNLRELFSIIRSVNYKLNEVYEFDDNHPANYNPENNDKNLVDILKDMLVGSYRVNIRNGMTLNQAFNTFDELCLLDEDDVIHHSYRKQRHSHPNNQHRREFKPSENERQMNNLRFQKTHNNNFGNTNYQRNFTPQQNQFNGSAQFRRQNNDQKQDRHFRDNNWPVQNRQNSLQYRQFNNRNNFSNNSNRFRNGPTNNRSDPVVPMEVDNIQQQDVNFSTPPQTENYQ